MVLNHPEVWQQLKGLRVRLRFNSRCVAQFYVFSSNILSTVLYNHYIAFLITTQYGHFNSSKEGWMLQQQQATEKVSLFLQDVFKPLAGHQARSLICTTVFQHFWITCIWHRQNTPQIIIFFCTTQTMGGGSKTWGKESSKIFHSQCFPL